MTKKEIAQDFLNLTSSGESRKAFDLYVADDFKHPNVWFKGDRDTLMIAMEDSAKEVPNKIFETKRILEDGALVAAHSHIKMTPDDLGYAVMHIFRFEQDKIVELWDFGQEIPKDMVNENGMF